VRQAKVEDDHARLERGRFGEFVFAIRGRCDAPTFMTQELFVDLAVILDVVDD
jgi:hypothetical protein